MQCQFREACTAVRGLKEAARVGPQATGPNASPPASMFSKALAELDGKLDGKLAPVVAEQRRLANSVDAVLKGFQALAVLLPILVAVWDIFVAQAGGVALLVHPRVHMLASAGLFAVAAASTLAVLLFYKQLIVKLWP